MDVRLAPGYVPAEDGEETKRMRVRKTQEFVVKKKLFF